MHDICKSIFNEAAGLSKRLIEMPSEDVKNTTSNGGVYLIRHNGKIIYVGKAKNLSRRINSDHISRENKNTTSTVRRKITRNLGIPHGKELRNWMSKCNFSTVKIDDPDLRALVETLTILLLRKQGELLLND